MLSLPVADVRRSWWCNGGPRGSHGVRKARAASSMGVSASRANCFNLRVGCASVANLAQDHAAATLVAIWLKRHAGATQRTHTYPTQPCSALHHPTLPRPPQPCLESFYRA